MACFMFAGNRPISCRALGWRGVGDVFLVYVGIIGLSGDGRSTERGRRSLCAGGMQGILVALSGDGRSPERGRSLCARACSGRSTEIELKGCRRCLFLRMTLMCGKFSYPLGLTPVFPPDPSEG